MDVVLHLAAVTSGRIGFYEGLLETNIQGVYNILRAAADQGCQRAIVMSSVQAIEGYPLDVQARTGDAPRPLNMYAASKAFAEATCHAFAASEGLSCIAVRVGSFDAHWVRRDLNARVLSTYVSRRDLCELLVRCIETADVPFAVVHGLSDNRFKRMDLTDTKALLAYEPRDDSFRLFDVGLRYMDRWTTGTGADGQSRPHPEDSVRDASN
jgi:NAD(P)-dependent dehydrogenase (short-subunit alcohol dehydrogenase family)